MTTHAPKLRDIPTGQVWVVVPPRIEAMVSGATQAGIYPDGRIVLVYEDGKREEAAFSAEDADALLQAESFFGIVSAVQSKREVR